MPFLEVVSLYQEELDERKIIEDRLKGDTALVLDEVVPPYTGPQAHFFAAKLEEIVRHRTNFNRVTIMTTNLDPGQLHHHYPRVYSLLEAKQVRIELAGDDARQSIIKPQNLAMVAAREVRPIT
jgi:DNA replication protein DnaC